MKGRSVFLATVILVGLPALCLADLYQWSVEDGGNGHYYETVLAPAGIDWEGANTAATERGGYLATLTSAEENAFVYDLVDDDDAFWRWVGPYNAEGPFLGGYQDSGTSDPAANWHWVTGEIWSYTNWVPIEPSGPELQNRLAFFGYCSRMGPQWNDVWSINYPANSYIIEYNEQPSVVPLPPALWLGVLGLGSAARRLRRKGIS
jgi:hypothetical protein